jgi:hypothetical protein
MLTLRDCIEVAGLDPEEVFAVAHHEHLPDIVALEKEVSFLQQEWGAPAVRQMILEECRSCCEAAGSDVQKAAEALALLSRTVLAHPGGCDRRQRTESDDTTETV